MAKKSAAKRRQAQAKAQERAQFDDSAYEGLLFSATFDYNELAFQRAADKLAPRARSALMAATFVSLCAIVALALLGLAETVPLVVLFVISLALLLVSNNWGRILNRYARRTTLAPVLGGCRMHVAVCEHEVHLEGEQGQSATFDLSDLRVVYDTSDYLVAGFGSGRYVYVPRAALSESRYQELVRFLHKQAER